MSTPARSLPAQLARHGFVWLSVGVFVLISSIPYIKPAEQEYVELVWGLTIGLTLLVYGTYAYWLFPRYLYAGRWVWLAMLSVGVFALVHGLTYAGYPLIQQTARVPEQALTRLTHPHLWYWFTVHELGVLGWIFTPNVIAVVLGTPYFFASPFLFARLIRHYVSLRRQTQQAELANLQVSGENTILELDLLKAQLNPHFLFNSLNSIYVRVIDVDDRAANLVLRLAELMRYNLYEADAPTVSLTQELAYIENYLNLEQARHGQRVEVLFSSGDDFGDLVIAPLILLAFVENAFRYGVGGSQQEAYVWVEAHLEAAETLVFTVQNSLATSVQRHLSDRQSGGEGLPDVRQRLAVLYPERHHVDTEQSTDSYAITLSVRLAHQELVPTN